MTELQENVIKVLEYKYGWSGIKKDSQMMQELFRDIVNATNDVINKSSDISPIKERSLPLTRPMVEDLINHAYQRGYEDRDLDIGYGSNRQYSIDEIDRKLKAHRLTSP